MSRALPHNLEDVLVSLISENFFDSEQAINPHTNLFEIGLDSMAIMQLVMLIDSEWGVAITAQDLTRENFNTSADIASLMRRMAAAQ